MTVYLPEGVTVHRWGFVTTLALVVIFHRFNRLFLDKFLQRMCVVSV